MCLLVVEPTVHKLSVSKSKIINSVKCRKYFDNYLSMGVTQDGDETSACPVCVLCNEVLPNNSVVPSKLKTSF